MTGRPESHHTLQVVALFMEFNHVQSLELKSEHSGNKTKSTISMREITSKSVGCSIQDEDVTLLYDMLKINTSLTKLNLNSYRHQRAESQMDCFPSLTSNRKHDWRCGCSDVEWSIEGQLCTRHTDS